MIFSELEIVYFCYANFAIILISSDSRVVINLTQPRDRLTRYNW